MIIVTLLSFHYIVDCGSLPDPANGQVTLNGTGFHSMANYTCDPGYGLVGNATRICQLDGTWSGSVSCQSNVHTIEITNTKSRTGIPTNKMTITSTKNINWVHVNSCG